MAAGDFFPRKILILGTGGNCIDILDTILDINDSLRETRYIPAGFLDDNPDNLGKEFFGVPVVGALRDASKFADCFVVNGIGSQNNFWKKKDIIAKTGLAPDRFETIIHPSASVSRMAVLGRGVVVFQNVTITSNVRIGDHVIILPNTVISHDDIIGDYCCFAGGVCISGAVAIEDSCYLGSRSVVINGTRIGAESLIGMGSVLLEDAPPRSVMVGNPARFLRKTY